MTRIGDKTSSMDQPIDHLVACHRRIEERLETLERSGACLDANRSEAVAAIQKSLDFLDSNGGWHTQDEEESVFPRLRRSLEPADLRYLHDLEMQHDEAEAVLERLKTSFAAVTAGAGYAAEFRNWAARLRELYTAHIASEEATLIDLARHKLSAEDMQLIAAEMKARRNGILRKI